MKMSAESIDEIQSKKRRDKGLEAWAEMLQRMHERGPVTQHIEQAESSGGASLPRDRVVMSDPKTVENRRIQMQAVQANNQAAQLEARRTQDVVQTSGKPGAAKSSSKTAESKEASKAKEAPKPQKAQPNKEMKTVVTSEATPAPEGPVQENVEAATFNNPLLVATSKEATEQRLQLASLADVEEPAAEPQAEPARTAEPDVVLSAAEEAAMLAALRSGVGAKPELIAKDYVLASELPGVKGTFQGGVYEEFRVAL
jgi:hypothetical protein